MALTALLKNSSGSLVPTNAGQQSDWTAKSSTLTGYTVIDRVTSYKLHNKNQYIYF